MVHAGGLQRNVAMFACLYNLIDQCRRSRAFAAMLVPAFLCATLPHSACFCADGRKETTCNAAVCCRIAAGENTSGPGCGCSCCQPFNGQQPRTCCLAETQIEPSKDSDSPRNARSVPCCKPVVQAPTPVARGKMEAPPTHKDLTWEFLPALHFVSNVPASPSIRPLDDYHGPPPLDAVILFLHLTI
jgi:hypothetical protein